MGRNVYYVFLFFLLLLSIDNVWAYKNTYAVIVGIADYAGDSKSDLTYTVRDAQLFCDFLMSQEGGKVPADHIYILKDSKASKANILFYTRKLFAKAGEDDRVIFFFSGHGSAGYLLPYDAILSSSNWLSYEEVKSLFRCAKAKTKLMYADACYSGDFKNTFTKKVRNKNISVRRSSDIAIMLSCGDNQYSMETSSLRQGVFSYFLVKGLKGAADRDSNKLITIQELFYYVCRETQQYAKNKGRYQKPVLIGKFDLRLIVGYRF